MITSAPWRRFLATFFDLTLLSTIFNIIPFSSNYAVVSIVLFFCSLSVYTVILESSQMQATLGQYFLKMKVTSLQGESITFKKASLRYLTGLILCVLFLAMQIASFFFIQGTIVFCNNLAPTYDLISHLQHLSFLPLILTIGSLLFYFCISTCLFYIRLCSKGKQTLQDYFSGTLLQLHETELNENSIEKIVIVGPWRRFFAAVLDIFLILIISIIMCAVFKLSRNHEQYFQSFIFCIGWLYFPFFESSSLQATPGEYFLRIKITSLSYSRLSLSQAAGRHSCFLFPHLIVLCGMFLGLGMLAFIVCLVFQFQGIQPDMIGDPQFIFQASIRCLMFPFSVAYFYLAYALLCSKGKQSFPDYFSNTLMLLKNPKNRTDSSFTP